MEKATGNEKINCLVASELVINEIFFQGKKSTFRKICTCDASAIMPTSTHWAGASEQFSLVRLWWDHFWH